MTAAYEFETPADQPTVRAIAEGWRPYRMWAVVLLHVWGRSELRLAPRRPQPAARRRRTTQLVGVR